MAEGRKQKAGSVPEGWREVSAIDIAAKSANALDTGPFGSSISSKYFVESGVPVIRGGNLSDNADIRFKDDNFVFISEEKAKEFVRSEVVSGDLIFTCWGTINQVGIIPKTSKFDKYIISNKQMKLSVDTSKILPLYAYAIFSSRQIQKQITEMSTPFRA